MEHGDGGKIQRVAGVVAIGADAPFTEDHLLIAVGHDIFCAHEQLLQRVGQTALQQDGLAELAQLPQQVEVLHIAGAHLQHIYILEQRQIHHAHDLGDDGQARLLPGDLQKLQPLRLQTGKVIGGGAGLEGAAPEHIRARRLDISGHGHDLLLRFHGAGAGE